MVSQPHIPLKMLVEVLTGDQGALFDTVAGPGLLRQVGAAVLPQPFPMIVPTATDPVRPIGDEPVIETFLVDDQGCCEAADPSETARWWWRPQAQSLVDRVLGSLTPLGVRLEFPAYVTASATPLGQVATNPHLDDPGLEPERGVGLVAIAASHGGPRLARGTVAHRPLRPPAPIDLDPDSLAGFESGTTPDQTTGADQIVVFPRFGQLHAGPAFVDPMPGEVRNLLVLRAGTRPRGQRETVRLGSGPT